MQPADCLRRYPLFQLLNARQRDAWLGGGQELAFATGETVFQEGSAGVWVYLVLAGQVRVVRRSEGGREVTLGMIGPGEVFGEYALLPPHRNTATCRATAASRLLRLPLLPLRALLEAFDEVQANLKNWLRLHGLLGHLRGQAFLGFMSAPSALKFLDRLEPVTFRAGLTIQADGLGDNRWYYLEAGQVALEAPGETPRRLGPGDCFGERTLAGREGLAVAVAATDARCLCLPRLAFAPRTSPSQQINLQSLLLQMSSVRKAYPWVGQQEAADCGVAALAMVARFHGLEVAVADLRRQARVGDRGVNLQELQRLAESLHLRCQAVHVDASQLGQVALPTIAHLSDGHFIVVYEMNVNGVVVGDPANGILRLSRDTFGQKCSGKLLLVHPPGRSRPGA